MSPLLAQSGHHSRADPCPLSGVKRTAVAPSLMSAFDPKRTSGFGLFLLDTGGLDDLCPLFGFGSNEITELGR